MPLGTQLTLLLSRMRFLELTTQKRCFPLLAPACPFLTSCSLTPYSQPWS